MGTSPQKETFSLGNCQNNYHNYHSHHCPIWAQLVLWKDLIVLRVHSVLEGCFCRIVQHRGLDHEQMVVEEQPADAGLHWSRHS